MLADAHLHLADLAERDPGFPARIPHDSWRGAAVSHDPEEFVRTEELRRQLPPTLHGFGIHPQNPREDTADFLAELCASQKIDFIGEAGFDFFSASPEGVVAERVRNPENLGRQQLAFEFQLGLAVRYRLPLVIHVRKAMDILLAYGRELSSAPSVIFHCWPGNPLEAEAILKKNVNAYFSFGTPVLRGSKHGLASLRAIPRERILAETDAPWQPPHHAIYTRWENIEDVTIAIARQLDLAKTAACTLLYDNFQIAYRTGI